MKRGSNCVIVPPETFFSDTRKTYKKDKGIPKPGAESKPIVKRRDAVMSEFRNLVSLKGRQERSLFVVEGLTLVGRALNDGLPVERILYTSDLLKDSDGITLLNQAHVEGVAHHQVSSGLMGTTTTTRPIPPVIASVSMSYRSAEDYHLQAGSSLLIVDGIVNPDNLGMVLRTADAAGIEGVIIIEKSASPFHKNCVRAARGAVGRIPLLRCDEPEIYLRSLTNTGFNVLGATSSARKELYDLELRTPLAFVVGNESDGMSIPVRNLCTNLVRIPMAPGQSSLNVGVATGILLYEFVRRKMLPG
jgi:TrmH family RNA methyltransferase